jgi:uncharacterized protein (TIGR00299 family) protein
MSELGCAWLSCTSGVAGDMVLGALLDAGAGLDEVRRLLGGLDLDGWSLGVEAVTRGGLRASRAVVGVVDDGEARPYSTIRSLLAAAALPERVRARSLDTFAALAEAEAARHGVALDEVHFHEVGGHDAIIDIVGTAAALEVLGIDEVGSSAIGLGSGTVAAAHGRIPAPAPATVTLLEGFEVRGLDVDFETATPTGAALLRALAGSSAPIPAMRITQQGFGAGSRDPHGLANVVVAILGRRPSAVDEQVAWLSTNLDDITGEHLALAVAGLLADGALDVWTQAITMKKGRPGHALNLLCRPADASRLQASISAATGSLGVRAQLLERRALERRDELVEVLGHQIRRKVSEVSAKPELDDVVAVAEATGRSVAEIDALARAPTLA